MRRSFVLLYIIVVMFTLTSCGAESDLTHICAGGAKDGKSVFSSDTGYQGKLSLKNDKAELCLINEYGETLFLKEKESNFLTGAYSLDSNNNLVIDIEDHYCVYELIGSEESKENYVKIHSRSLTGNDQEMSRINGDKYTPDEKRIIASFKLRLDTENDKFYPISYKTKSSTVTFSYYESGALKSVTERSMGSVLSSREFDENGRELKNGTTDREYHDNGIIKKRNYNSRGLVYGL